ncbi:MAG: hypothetical protein ACLTUR_10085 [Paraclostridium sordellii]
MKFINNNENKIIIVACTLTVIVILGFTIMQGSVKAKDSIYISKEVDPKDTLKLTKEDYEIIKKDEKGNKDIFIVLEKRKLTTKERASLVNIIEKNTKRKYQIYLFNDKEKANNFEYKIEQIKVVINPIGSKKVEVKEYHTIEKQIKDKPQYYVINNVKENADNTVVEVNLENIKKPEKALSQIKFLVENIKELNPNKNLENLEVKAYDERTKTSWEYSTVNDNIVVHSQIFEI